MPDRTRRRTPVAFALAGLALAAWVTSASAQQGSVGQGLNNAGQAVKRGFQSAGQAVSGTFVKARTSVHGMEVVSRIYSRLHWDKTLTTSTLELEVRDGGVAIVTGSVPDAGSKAKALTLTAETVGVARVIDQVTISARDQAAPIVPGNAPAAIPGASTVITPGASAPVAVPPATRARGDGPI